jgi:hypothetical protein
MAAPDPKTPTRAQLYKVLNNHELVRLFEKLFEMAGETTPNETEEINIAAGIAGSKANQAIGASIENKIKANEALTLLWLTTN